MHCGQLSYFFIFITDKYFITEVNTVMAIGCC